MLCRVFELRRSPGQDLLTIDRQEEDGSVTLSLRGEIDLASVPLLRQELKDAAQASPRRIVLDLAALAFIDSTGIHALLEAQGHAASNAHVLVLTNVPAHVRRLFRIADIEAHIPIE